MSDDWYLTWIEQRRAAAPRDEMPERVMQLVMEVQTTEKQILALRFASWIERSRVGRYVACGAALLIGSTPFVTYFAYLMSV
ncbi:MAG TPA: hypothetical protein VJ809_04380 [Pirellulales bacterium]|jgi:hypothetical protein|nr:hypothetical protein [Pirellulales bacterium]